MEPYIEDDMPNGHEPAAHLADVMHEVDRKLNEARKYIRAANTHRPIDKALADSFANISAQELQHSDILSNAITSMLSKLKAQGNTCYDTMSVVWKHTYEQQSKYAAWIRQMHADYKKLT